MGGYKVVCGMQRGFMLALLAMLLTAIAGCRTPEIARQAPPPSPPPPPPLSAPPPTALDPGDEGGSRGIGEAGKAPGLPNFSVEHLFYATDRAELRAVTSQQRFGGERGTLSYGECEVSIPHDHRMGDVERPSLWRRFAYGADPARDVTVLSVDPRETAVYYADLNGHLAQSEEGSVLVFIHGYNVTFQEAAQRTAQMAYDLAFPGPAVFFSWPSRAELLGYTSDEDSVAWATPHLKEVLQGLLHRTHVRRVYLIAHSMGNRAMVSAFQELIEAEPELRARIREVILAAPDIDAQLFKAQILPALTGSGRHTTHVTLYASRNDEALLSSKVVHHDPRAGESGEDVVLARGLDTIDASAVDTSFVGHSYYAESASILADIYYLMRNQRACQRVFLEPLPSPVGTYCAFRAQQ